MLVEHGHPHRPETNRLREFDRRVDVAARFNRLARKDGLTPCLAALAPSEIASAWIIRGTTVQATRLNRFSALVRTGPGRPCLTLTIPSGKYSKSRWVSSRSGQTYPRHEGFRSPLIELQFTHPSSKLTIPPPSQADSSEERRARHGGHRCVHNNCSTRRVWPTDRLSPSGMDEISWVRLRRPEATAVDQPAA